ncbi:MULTISPECIES: aminotransferase class V-fold PLP-dependent enzyme [Ruegeria]|uniref:aminotransferase class V-fold PLP-dependent enzyme n=1 Tax=Ruegeria TaxID=97050 RepID=UPI00147B6E5A|nr:aminotransferase class V-fold PLP-dependent enzyme [Ruegeria atlantica]
MLIGTQNTLSEVINARGVFTPLGVSRSSKEVCEAVSDALGRHFIMDDLHDAVGREIAEMTNASAATVVHCSAAAITLAVAASMTGSSPGAIKQLPDASGLKSRVILPANHAVNYGHPIEQAIRLAGAKPELVGDNSACGIEDLAHACSKLDACCLVLVSSRLTGGEMLDFRKAVSAAHEHDLPVVIDGAAQDFRIEDLLDTGADVVLISGQKYLAGPTSGLVLGKPDLVSAVRAQEKGIGRGMKASKEVLLGVLTALKLRQQLNKEAWSSDQKEKVARFVSVANTIEGITAKANPDPTNLPFDRVHLCIAKSSEFPDAAQMAAALKAGEPSIWIMDHLTHQSEIVLELVQLTQEEIDTVLDRIREVVSQYQKS